MTRSPATRPRRAPEPAQPVFTRYWLHGKGPAPAGNLPVAVHLSPGRIALAGPDGGDAAGRGASCASPSPAAPSPRPGRCGSAPDARARLEPSGPLRYDLRSRGYACWDIAVRARARGRPARRHFVTAQITDGSGQLFEDATLVTIGEPAAPALDLPLDELLPLYLADEAATAAELDLALLTPELRLRPGDSGQIAVRLGNATASQIRGEAQLVSPFGSWAETEPWTRGFSAGPAESTTLAFGVTVPATARPGQHWWALVKVMYFGRGQVQRARGDLGERLNPAARTVTNAMISGDGQRAGSARAGPRTGKTRARDHGSARAAQG